MSITRSERNHIAWIVLQLLMAPFPVNAQFHRDTRLRLIGVMCAIAILAACSQDRPNAAGDDAAAVTDTTPAPPVGEPNTALPAGCEGLEHEMLKAVPTRAELHKHFGEPVRIDGVAAPNRHVPGVTDSLFTINYPGLVVHVHMPGGGSDMPTRVEIEDNRYLAFPRIGIGAAEDSVLTVLGPRAQRDSAGLIYDCGEHTNQPVRFELAAGRVHRIIIEYYVD